VREVVALTAAGLGPDAVARRLGLRPDVVAAVLDQAQRLGLAAPAAVGGCAACAAPRSGCAGCPLARAAPVAGADDRAFSRSARRSSRR
jgi:hypothetical protein